MFLYRREWDGARGPDWMGMFLFGWSSSIHVAYLPSSPDYDGGFHACGLITVSEEVFAVLSIINYGRKVPFTESTSHQSGATQSDFHQERD